MASTRTLTVTLSFPDDVSEENVEWYTGVVSRTIAKVHGSHSSGITATVTEQEE